MTRDEINQANADTLNRLAATELMGWRPFRWAEIDIYGRVQSSARAFYPSTDANDAATCRRKIEERGLLTESAMELAAIVFGWKPWRMEETAERLFTDTQVVEFLDATPEQITRACLLTVCKEESK